MNWPLFSVNFFAPRPPSLCDSPANTLRIFRHCPAFRSVPLPVQGSKTVRAASLFPPQEPPFSRLKTLLISPANTPFFALQILPCHIPENQPSTEEKN